MSKITIVTVCYNAEKFIEDSIRSVVNEKNNNISIEYIIIDGDSKDNTINIIRKYDSFIDNWISEKDTGIYDAMNKGLRIASGDWIIFLGADDRLFPNSLKNIINKLVDYNTAYYGNVIHSLDGRIFDGYFSKLKIMYKNISHQSIFYPKKYYKKNNYITKYKIAADYVYLLNYVGNKFFKLKYEPVLISIYNNTDGVSSKNEDFIFFQDRLGIIKNNFNLILYYIYYFRLKLVSLSKKIKIYDCLKKIKIFNIKY